jgi:CubicO group peptidase (beta-lactamase class C family)
MNVKKTMPIIILLVIVVALIVLFITFESSFTYFKISMLHQDVYTTDYKIFRSRAVKTGDQPYHFNRDEGKEELFTDNFSQIDYMYKGNLKKASLEELFKDTETTAFIVIKDDTVYCEKYDNGYKVDSAETSFSISKSFVSTLVGIAIKDGYISQEDPINKYLPELKGDGFDKITIKDLLLMSSGIAYTTSGDFRIMKHMSDESKSYRYPDLRRLVLDINTAEEPGKHFLYNNYHPMLLGIIIERVTNMSVSEYMQEKLWKPLGMEHPASWSIDYQEYGFEKLESGFNASAIDFAKLGQLYLNNGIWEGKQILPENWAQDSTMPDPNIQSKKDYYPEWIQNDNLYYKYLWWGYQREGSMYEYFAWGTHGQYIYVFPEKNIVMVRLGRIYGLDEYYWPEIFRDIANKI